MTTKKTATMVILPLFSIVTMVTLGATLANAQPTMEYLTRIALDNAEVQEVLDGKTAEPRRIGYVIDLDNPSKEQPVLHMRTSDKVISVRFNPESTDVQFVSAIPHRVMNVVSENGIASAYYDGSESIDGIQMKLDAPPYSHETGADWTAILVNGVKLGSDTLSNKICDSTEHPDHYWAQGGLMFDSDDTDAVWTDTLEDCLAVDSTLTVSDNDQLEKRVYVNDYQSATDEVVIELENIDENELYRVTTEVSNTSTLETGDPNTSVFFENSHTETTTTWEDGFTSGDLVVDSAQYRDSSDSNWYTWDGQSEEKQCGGSPTTSELMSGSFTSGSVTWDLSNMRSKCDAP